MIIVCVAFVIIFFAKVEAICFNVLAPTLPLLTPTLLILAIVALLELVSASRLLKFVRCFLTLLQVYLSTNMFKVLIPCSREVGWSQQDCSSPLPLPLFGQQSSSPGFLPASSLSACFFSPLFPVAYLCPSFHPTYR